MKSMNIRELQLSDETAFLSAMQRSRSLYDPWMSAPLTHDQFIEFFNRYSQVNHKCFLLCNTDNDLVGVFNLSEIVRGVFQNAYLGFSAVVNHAGKGYMSVGLKILLNKFFTEMELHHQVSASPRKT